MTVAAVNTTLVVNVPTLATDNVPTADTADLAEVFNITPSKAEYKVAIEIEVGPTNGAVAYSIAAGGYWASLSPLTGSVAQATKRVIVLEGAKYKSATGVIAITFTPASTKRLLTDHALKVRVIQLP